ncbi:unnamed protein product [Arctia plantaginis]|uniref:Uncharacterized protein n=1 Tax=Arctia plantaginis TaxID=874455 RepID=A0A8S0YYV9_ARCPL|nr:unnamed protein product [Arctia plantaginis]CAB3229872.1 unnamed protein product [Arctia plantaginis]
MGKRVYPAEAPNHWDFYSKMMSNYVSTFYATISGNYVVIVTLLFVMVLTFLLPDISNKLQASHELKNMKELMGKMTSEVKQAEVACLAVADEICCIHCAMKKSNTETQKQVRDLSVCTSHCMQTTQSEPARTEKEVGFIRRIFFPIKNTSNKEVTIMSYVYTNSFDAQKPVITASQ